MKNFKLFFFQSLARINKLILPRYSKRDITKLSKWDKLVIGYRYYITKNALGDK